MTITGYDGIAIPPTAVGDYVVNIDFVAAAATSCLTRSPRRCCTLSGLPAKPKQFVLYWRTRL